MYKIAITGKANTGKNTLANLLKEETYEQAAIEYKAKHNGAMLWSHGERGRVYATKFMAFADPIKEIVMIMFPNANRECLYGPSQLRAEAIPGAFKEGKPLSYRQALIDIGTEVGRAYNDKVWLENFDARYQELLIKNVPDFLAVTDVRFRNEFEHLKRKDFFQIRLYRDTGKASEINHVSETNQNTILDEEFDYVLFNNKSLDELREEIKLNIIPRLKR
jgi:hypothetical protein